MSNNPIDPGRWLNPTTTGNCLCRPSNPECRRILEALGLEGIEYKDGEPQFSACSVASIQVPMMTRERKNKASLRTKEERKHSLKDNNYEGLTSEQVDAQIISELTHDYAVAGNFDIADAKLAAQWTAERKDAHVWTALDVQHYREKHKLSWHERQDMMTMDLVPRAIHEDFRHLGGTGIQKQRHRLTVEAEEEFIRTEGMYDERSDAELERYEQEQAVKKALMKSDTGFAPLQLIILIGLLAGFVGSYIATAPNDLLQNIMWLIAAVGPYVALAFVCIKFNGLPDIMQSRTGGIILLVIFALLFILVPFISTLLFGVYLVAGAVFIFRSGGSVVDAFAPKGRIRVERHEADGHVSIQDVDVYGDMNQAMRTTEEQLRNEGYNDVRHD